MHDPVIQNPIEWRSSDLTQIRLKNSISQSFRMQIRRYVGKQAVALKVPEKDASKGMK